MFSSLWARFWKTTSDEDNSDNDVKEEQPVQEVTQHVDVGPGGLSFEEGTAGGLGRHLGVISCTFLIVGRIIGSGIFSTPSLILNEVQSIGASLMLWVLGFVLSFCGLFIWLELGTMYPRSGGEKVYLEAVYQRPKYLSTVVFAANAIFVGYTAGGCVAFVKNILVAAGTNSANGSWSERSIALGATIVVALIHGLAPRTGVHIMNLLTIFKIVILIFVVITGLVVLSGNTHILDPQAKFSHAFANSPESSSNYATATFKVLYAYNGWSNVNYVLNNVRNPVRTLKIAGPLGLGICAAFYILANIAYFSAATKDEIVSSGVTVAALFFGNVFGPVAKRAMGVFVALSALGSIITVGFAAARVNQELAKEGIPLPFGNRFWASNWPTGKSPLPGLIIYFIPSVIVILVQPTDDVYSFMVDIDGYSSQIISFFIVIGLFWLRWTRPDIPRPFKVWWPLAAFYLVAVSFLLVAPFMHPSDGKGDSSPLSYYTYCLVSIGVFLAGAIYWAGWRIILPRVFGYELVPRKETLEDGTVVTLYSRAKIE